MKSLGNVKFRVMWRNKNFNGWCEDTEIRQSYKQAESSAKALLNRFEDVIEVAVKKIRTEETIEFTLRK